MSEHRLSEVVIERPRGGMRISLKKLKGFKKQLYKLTEEASQDGLLSPYLIKPRNKSKHLSDQLGPLRRFLRSHVGQPWNEVYSKLCQQLDTKTMAGQHVLTHLWEFVERHVELIDGIPYSKRTHRRFSIPHRLDSHYTDKFYVHPETGILCASANQPRKRWNSWRPDVVKLDEYHEYHQLHGIWYLITFEEVPPPPTQTVIDVLDGEIFCGNGRWMNGRRMYATRKQQCSKKELRFIRNQLSQS
ncbi:hypothetical protein PCC9214_03014 [Planktothrix tepida]|uniref:Uncharacterized protein n=1 Tax=Planktothrix tepida PCC 9214 TaxID=671072 RepID=A0A1J1LRT4_9CYAN|nr:hypothetical protein [Planktothrix tepida]CAD5958311.1 hypothetical protein PCC9214_03014 [Planktothrix tepida]CUR34564.1 conserved hypothetical protein [Planktothrix tepida PCC 9214]